MHPDEFNTKYIRAKDDYSESDSKQDDLCKDDDHHHRSYSPINESCAASTISSGSCSGKTSPINGSVMMMMMNQSRLSRPQHKSQKSDYDQSPDKQQRDNSVGSQTSSGGTARSSSSCNKYLDSKDNLQYLINGKGNKNKEVIPQRKRRDFIPNELKDEHYWERRRKNNLAAKRSREKRRLNDIVLETKVLELTNLNNVVKLKLDLIMRKYEVTDDEVDKLFEENKHLLVIQETLDMSELLTNDDSLTAYNDTEHLSSSSSTTSSSSLLSNLSKTKSPNLESITDNDEYIHSPMNSNENELNSANSLLLLASSSMQRLSGRSSSSSVLTDNTEDDEDKDEKEDKKDDSPPPSKRKTFFENSQSTPTISPLISPPPSSSSCSSSSSVSSLKLRNEIKIETNDDLDKTNDNQSETPMKSQYPLLYNQLCKTNHKQDLNPIEQLNSLINRNGQQQQQMSSVINELIKNEFAKKNAQFNQNSISVGSLLQQQETNNANNDILTKILTSNLPTSNNQNNTNLMERLMLLTNQQQQQQTETSRTNQANALMEKYKNLIQKTNSSHKPQFNTSASLKSALLSSNLKNTVNNLLQNLTPTTQPESDKSNKRKRANQATVNANAPMKTASFLGHYQEAKIKSDEAKLLQKLNDDSTVDYSMYNNYQQNGDLNDMVSLMLSSSVAQAAAAQQRAQSNKLINQQQRLTATNNKNISKNQAYNQLLMLHHQQQLQQQQQRLENTTKRNDLMTSPILNEQLSALQSNQQQQQQQQFAQFNQQTANNANGDNMPLKLRFKMLQLKTGEVN